MLTTEEFIRLYPITRTVELAEILGIKPVSVWTKARRLGVRKSAEIISLENSITNKGRTRSDETREKLRQVNTGRKASSKTRAKQSLRQRSNSAAKRGISLEDWKPLPRRIIDSSEYIAWRNKVYIRDSYTCQDCGYVGEQHSRAVYAHHILGWKDYPESRYDVSNGITVCFKCHAKRHGWAIQSKEPIVCACGCGQFIPPADRWRKQNRFIKGHWVRTRPMTDEIKKNISRGRKGIRVCEEGRKRHAEVMRTKFGGKKRSPEVCAKISAAKMGHTVTDATKEKLSLININRHHRRIELGIPHHTAKFTRPGIIEIRQQRDNGESCKNIALQYGVNTSTIERIVKRQTYKHVL